MRRLVIYGLGLCGLLMAVGAVAAPAIQQEYATNWHQVMSVAARMTLRQPQLRTWIDGLFWTLAFTALMRSAFDFMRDRGDWLDFVYTIVFVVAVRGSMFAYDGITNTMYGASQAIGGLYSAGILGYPAESWIELLDVLTHVQLPEMSIWDATIGDIIGIFIMMICTSLLALAAWIAAVYNEWQYLIVKIIGLFFIPWVLFKVTREYFLNWLHLFVSVCLFNLVLGILAPALLLAVKIAFGFDHSMPIAGQPTVILSLDNPIAYLAGPAFILVGILMLMRATAIAQSLAGTGSALSLNLRQVTSGAKMVMQ